MKQGPEHTDKGDLKKDQHMDFFEKAGIPYSKAKADVWDSLSEQISESNETKSFSINRRVFVLGVAAVVVLLMAIGSFLRFYTSVIEVPSGKHLVYTLPDGSVVEVNAHSTLSYHPYWWTVKREVSLDGEAYFEVTEGNEFGVVSENGTTKVLGTSFNVFSREGKYRVACLTGKVQVISQTNESVILSPNYRAEVGPGGMIIVNKLENPERTVSWKDDMFSFTAVPLAEVFDEVQRQYNVQIITQIDPRLTYTGFFSRDKHIEEVLSLLCKPFGLTFVKQGKGVYLIEEK